jgi:hypothetical protein
MLDFFKQVPNTPTQPTPERPKATGTMEDYFKSVATPETEEAPREGFMKGLAREALQVPKAIYSGTVGLPFEALSQPGIMSSPEQRRKEVEQQALLRGQKSPEEMEKYMQDYTRKYNEWRQFQHNMPTGERLGEIVEEKTGLPTKAGETQGALGTGALVSLFTPGGWEKKLLAGAGAGAGTAGLQTMGVPKPWADFFATLGTQGPHAFEAAKDQFMSLMDKGKSFFFGKEPEVIKEPGVHTVSKAPTIGVRGAYKAEQVGEKALQAKPEAPQEAIRKTTSPTAIEGAFKGPEDLGKTVQLFESMKTNSDIASEQAGLPPKVEVGSEPIAPEKHVKKPGEVATEEQELVGKQAKEKAELERKHGEEPVTLSLRQVSTRPKFTSSLQGGNDIQAATIAANRESWGRVGDAYAQSRELNSEEVRPREAMRTRLQEYSNRFTHEQIADPTTIQAHVHAAIERVLDEYAGRGVSNQELINQIQAWNDELVHRYPHGDPHNVFRPAIETLEREVLSTTTDEAARNAFEGARDLAREHYDTFARPGYVKELSNLQNRDTSKAFGDAMKTDNYNQLRPILEQTPAGQVVAQQLMQNMVEQRLNPFLKKGVIEDTEGFTQEVNDIDRMLTPEERAGYHDEVRRLTQESNANAKVLAEREAHKKTLAREEQAEQHKEQLKKKAVEARTAREKEAEAKHAKETEAYQERVKQAKERVEKEAELRKGTYGGKSPEAVAKGLHNVTGLKEFETTIGRNPDARKFVERVKQYVAASTVRETGLSKLFEAGNKDKLELVEHAIGKQGVEQLRELGKQADLGKRWFGKLAEAEKHYKELAGKSEKESAARAKYKHKLSAKEVEQYEKAKRVAAEGIFDYLTEHKGEGLPKLALEYGLSRLKLASLNKLLRKVPKASPAAYTPKQVQQVYQSLVPTLAVIAKQNKD